MATRNSDQEWERFGSTDPYFGVLTQECFRGKSLSPETSDAFFASGRAHVAQVLEFIHHYVDPDFRPASALDFGCGVGRVLIPLALDVERATGVDVSASMLRETEKNRALFGAKSVSLVHSLHGVLGEYDLIHSFVVFQHIPLERGYALYDELLGRLQPGGVSAIHFTVASKKGNVVRLVARLKHQLPLLAGLINWWHRRPFSHPVMQMNHTICPRCYVWFVSTTGALCTSISSNWRAMIL